MATYGVETRSVKGLWRDASAVGLVTVSKLGPPRSTTPHGNPPTQAEWQLFVARMPGGPIPVTPVFYELVEAFKGLLPEMEWWPGGQLTHRDDTLRSSVEHSSAIPGRGTPLVLFRGPDLVDWSGGAAVPPLNTRRHVATFELVGDEAVYYLGDASVPVSKREPRFSRDEFLLALRELREDQQG